jgi:hypothetical protein
MRKPSCLISCNQPGPEGGAFAGDGRQGSIFPSLEGVRPRNHMGDLIGNRALRVEDHGKTLAFRFVNSARIEARSTAANIAKLPELSRRFDSSAPNQNSFLKLA